LTINHGTHTSTTIVACESYLWKDRTYTKSGVYVFTYNNQSDCPSADTLHLTINPLPVVNVNGNTVCADQAGTLTATVEGLIPSVELVTNGNFDSGNTGFISQYIDVTTPYNGSPNSGLWPEGTYAVTSNPHYPPNFHPSFYGTGHGGSGNFMAVNGSKSAGTVVWEETVNILPNTKYFFSTWVSAINPANLANLEFSINGVLLGPVIAPPAMVGTTNPWAQFYAEWTSGPSTTTADIKIIDENTIAGGNDYGLDDISFNTVLPCAFTYLWNDAQASTTSSISVTDNKTYCVTVTNSCTGCSASACGNVEFKPLLKYTCGPEVLKGNIGDNITLSVTATGSNVTYQWYDNNGGLILGATNSSYTINNAQLSNEGSYCVYLASDCGTGKCCTTIHLCNPPAVTISKGSEICEGGSFTFTATTTGTPVLNYQWYKGTTLITGAIQSTFTVITSTSDDAGTYSVVVTNACGSATSNASTLVIDTKPRVSCPGDVSLCGGKSTSFTVTASGTGVFSYQWYANGILINDGAVYTGTKTNKLNVLDVTGLNGYVFTVVVTNNCGSTTSCKVTLTVTNPPAITVQPQSITKCATPCGTPSGKACFSVTATGDNLTYQWQENGVNIVDNAYFSGAKTTTLCVAVTSCKTGKCFRVVVSNSCGSATSTCATLTINNPPVITKKPNSVCVTDGQGTSFTVVATNGITYQWQVNGINIQDNSIYSGSTTPTLTISNVSGLNNKQFRCIVCNDCGCVTSCAGSLVVKFGCAPPVNERSCEVTSYSGKQVWNVVSGAKGYEVMYWTSGSNNARVVTTTKPYWILCYLKSNTTYCWKVRTICYTCGCSCYDYKSQGCSSDWSDTYCFTTNTCTCKDGKLNANSTALSSDIKVYPNPTTGIVNIALPNAGTASDLVIFNMSGQTVYSEKVSALDNTTKQVDMSTYQQGVYFVRVSNDQFTKTIKLILQ
jgi:hypothetical protein